MYPGTAESRIAPPISVAYRRLVKQEKAVERIGLKEAIEALRSELSESIIAAAADELRFEVGEINLQFQVEVERTLEATSSIKFWVMEARGKGKHASSSTHTITIPLKPVSGADRSPVLTGGTGPKRE